MLGATLVTDQGRRGPGQPRKAETKLAKWLDEQGKSREWLAGELGVTVTTVHRWCSGASRPRPEVIAKLEELTRGGVTFQDWIRK